MTHENLLNDVRDALGEIAQGTLRPAHFVAQEALTRLDAFLDDVPDLTDWATWPECCQMDDPDMLVDVARMIHTATTKGNDDE